MTREEFIEAYCRRSDVKWEWLSQHLVALPCACGEDGCEGWAMVPKDEKAIAYHNRRYVDAYARAMIETVENGAVYVRKDGAWHWESGNPDRPKVIEDA